MFLIFELNDFQGSELDPELSLIMCKLDESTNQSDIKNYLMEIELYQNQHPIEQLVPQKALYSLASSPF